MWKCESCGCANDDSFTICKYCGYNPIKKKDSSIVESNNENQLEFSGSGVIGLRRLYDLSVIMLIISALIFVVTLFACEFEAYKIERHLGWFIIGLAGIISNIIAMPILKALATITEAAFIYKSKHKLLMI